VSSGLAGANLKLKREAQIAETSANDAGEFEFTKLSPGKYTLAASLEGFESSSETITVRAGKTLFKSVNLELANQASVTVPSTARRLATTETASLSTLVPTPTVSVIDYTARSFPGADLEEINGAVTGIRATNNERNLGLYRRGSIPDRRALDNVRSRAM